MNDGMLVLTRRDLETLGVTWSEIVSVLEDAFRQKAAGLVQNPPKPAVRPRPDAFMNAMPAYLGGSDRAGIKWVAGYEGNREKGLPYIQGVFLLSDAETGRPIALIDGGWITEMRTAGVSGVVLRHVTSAERRLAIVGCGAQGRRHLELILAERPAVEEIRAFDRSEIAAAALLEGAGGRRALQASSAREALDGADLIVTAVTVELPDEDRTMAGVDPDAVLLPLDYSDAIGPSVANDATLYAVDDLDQYLSVAEQHFVGFRSPDAELAPVVVGEVAVPDTGRRVFMNLGIAMDDVALGALVYERARDRGAGATIAFP